MVRAVLFHRGPHFQSLPLDGTAVQNVNRGHYSGFNCGRKIALGCQFSDCFSNFFLHQKYVSKLRLSVYLHVSDFKLKVRLFLYLHYFIFSFNIMCVLPLKGVVIILYEGGPQFFGFIKKSTSYGTEKMYSLYIFPPELHTLMTSLF
jgi:hypothetical protein